jgi:transposase
LTTKLHVAVDALGNPLRVILSAGQIADIEQAEALIKDQPAGFVVADKGYDSDAFADTVSAQGAQPVIPPRSNRLNPRTFDRHIYKSRNLIERFFSRINSSDASPPDTTNSPNPSCRLSISLAPSSGWLK